MHAQVVIFSERQREYAIEQIREMPIDPSKPHVLTVEPQKKKRSLSQNALMWKWLNEVVAIVGDATGNDSDQLHWFFKQKFLKPEVVEVHGETAFHYTTTKLTPSEMSEYMDKIYSFVTQELRIRLTLPEERHAA